jgi:hypothetical protein
MSVNGSSGVSGATGKRTNFDGLCLHVLALSNIESLSRERCLTCEGSYHVHRLDLGC